MTVDRKQIGDTIHYRGRLITVHHMGPDLIVKVGGQQVGNFWIDSSSAIEGAKRYIDQIILEREKKEAKK